jgi:hypothetical protein
LPPRWRCRFALRVREHYRHQVADAGNQNLA